MDLEGELHKTLEVLNRIGDIEAGHDSQRARTSLWRPSSGSIMLPADRHETQKGQHEERDRRGERRSSRTPFKCGRARK